eukprot:s385_g10.t1
MQASETMGKKAKGKKKDPNAPCLLPEDTFIRAKKLQDLKVQMKQPKGELTQEEWCIPPALHSTTEFKETIKFWQNCAIVQHTERSMKVPSRMKIVEDERKCEKTSKTRKEVTELFKFLKTMNKQATKRTGQFLKQLEKKEGKETKRETLLKQIKDVDELMNEETSSVTCRWQQKSDGHVLPECRSWQIRLPVKCLRYKLAGSEQELRNARKFVERQQLFEKKYMVGSKLGEQAPRKNALILIEQSDVQSSWVDEAMGKMTLKDLDVKGKRVFIRVDFNDKNDPSVITNTQRIDGAMPTIRHCLKKGAKSVVLCSHLGRPDGKVVEKYSLAPVAKAAEEILGQSILFLKDCVGSEVEAACADPEPGSVILLENLRFHIEEEGKNEAKEKADVEKVKEFRASLAKLGDIYVNDAFGTAHRAHSSMVGDGFETKVAGFLMGKELASFGKVLNKPRKPLLAILGGAKVSDKILLIKNMLDKVDMMIIGGRIRFVMSSTKPEGAKIVPEIMEKAAETCLEMKSKLSRPKPLAGFVRTKGADLALGESIQQSEGEGRQKLREAFVRFTSLYGMRTAGLDCGSESQALNKKAVKKAKTIIWNGPMGVFEMERAGPRFDRAL